MTCPSRRLAVNSGAWTWWVRKHSMASLWHSLSVIDPVVGMPSNGIGRVKVSHDPPNESSPRGSSLVRMVVVASGRLRSVGSDWESGFVLVRQCERPRRSLANSGLATPSVAADMRPWGRGPGYGYW